MLRSSASVYYTERKPKNKKLIKYSIAHLLNIYSPLCCRRLNANNVLVVCYGLLAKWLMVRVRARARECTSCTFFPSGHISVVNTFIGFVVFISARQVTYEHSIHDITVICIMVNLAFPVRTIYTRKNFNPKWVTSVAGSVATTSHFYHSVGLIRAFVTQSSNIA